MKILILEGETYQAQSKDKPKPGITYLLEDASKGTSRQNRAFHPLLMALYRWMQRTDTYQFEVAEVVYDLRCADWHELKELVKYRYGAGRSHYQYVNDKYEMVKVKELQEIPKYVLDDFNGGNKKRIKVVLKSWGEYTKRQRKDTLDALINLTEIIGCDDRRVRDIIEGMQEEKG